MEKLFHCLYSIWHDFKKDIKNLLTAVFFVFWRDCSHSRYITLVKKIDKNPRFVINSFQFYKNHSLKYDFFFVFTKNVSPNTLIKQHYF